MLDMSREQLAELASIAVRTLIDFGAARAIRSRTMSPLSVRHSRALALNLQTAMRRLCDWSNP